MNKELFGVFGDRPAFERHRSPADFDRVLKGDGVTVGVRDDGLDEPDRTHAAVRDDSFCVVWGEAYAPDGEADPAAVLLDRYPTDGTEAVAALNGSFVAVVDHGDGPVVVGDPLRSRECFYTDATDPRAFGTDPAAVVDLLDDPAPQRQSLLEFTHMGVVLGDRTFFDAVRRVPFDGYLGPDDAGTLSRFVYDPAEFDYAASLARRLRRAIRRRDGQPGRTGVLLSAGYDSRVLLAELPDVDRCYTVGRPDSDEVEVSRAIADDYGVQHRVLDPAHGYLNTEPPAVQYGQGVKESLQVHHAIDGCGMDVDSVHHGLLFDTLLAGHFRPRDGVDVLGHTLPRRRLDPDPDVAETLLRDNFGFWELSDRLDGQLDDRLDGFPGDSVAFCRDAIETQRDRLDDRFDTTYDAIAALGVQNQPTLPFHTHLADNYFATFVAADAELVDWHLRTPPEHRNPRTYRRALERLDSSLLSPRPPDRPRASYRRNQVEKFLRRHVPGLTPFESAWPDRGAHYERTDLDRRLFGDATELRDLPPRVKLRVNDAVRWLDDLVDGDAVDAADVVSPP